MLDVIASRWYIILVTVVVAVVAAWFLHAQIPERYTADTILRLHPVAGEEPDLPYRLDFADRLMNSYATLAESDWMRHELASRLGTTFEIVDRQYDVAAEIPANTDLIRLSISHESPDSAARAANEAGGLLAGLSRQPAALPADAGAGEADLVQASAASTLALAVFDPATPPGEPSSLGFIETLVLAGLLGLIAGSGIAAASARADRADYYERGYLTTSGARGERMRP